VVVEEDTPAAADATGIADDENEDDAIVS